MQFEGTLIAMTPVHTRQNKESARQEGAGPRPVPPRRPANTGRVPLRDEDPVGYKASHRRLMEIYQPKCASEALAVEHLAEASYQVELGNKVEQVLMDSAVDLVRQEHPESPRAAAFAATFCGEQESEMFTVLKRFEAFRTQQSRRYREALREVEEARESRRKEQLHQARLEALLSRTASGGSQASPGDDVDLGEPLSLRMEASGGAGGTEQTGDAVAELKD